MKFRPLSFVSVLLVKHIYRRFISPRLSKVGVQCRFYPTCSEYAIQAIQKYGFFEGWTKAINRIGRCRPTNYDSCVDIP